MPLQAHAAVGTDLSLLAQQAALLHSSERSDAIFAAARAASNEQLDLRVALGGEIQPLVTQQQILWLMDEAVSLSGQLQVCLLHDSICGMCALQKNEAVHQGVHCCCKPAEEALRILA